MQKPSLDSRKSLLSFEVGLFLDYCLVLDDASSNVCTIHGITCQKFTKRNTLGGGRGAFKGSLGRVVPRRPSNPDPV